MSMPRGRIAALAATASASRRGSHSARAPAELRPTHRRARRRRHPQRPPASRRRPPSRSPSPGTTSRTTTRASACGRPSPTSTRRPTRTSRSNPGPRERGVQDKLATTLQPGDVPDLFQSWGGGGLAAAGRGRAASRTSPPTSPSWKDTINPGALSMYQVDGKQYGVPFDLGLVGFWYNKALFAQAGITAPPATWDEFLADVEQAQGRGHHPDRPGRQGQVAGDVLVGLPRRSASAAATAMDEGGPDRRLEHRRLRQGRRPSSSKLIDLEPYQDGLPGRRLQRRGSRRRQRQGRDGAHGPVGPGRPDGPERRQGGHRRRPRLVPVPDRRRWRRRRRPTVSAAATASPSARTRRPRRSTS